MVLHSFYKVFGGSPVSVGAAAAANKAATGAVAFDMLRSVPHNHRMRLAAERSSNVRFA